MTDEDIPDVLLELYALGELGDEDAALVRAWLDEHGEDRLDALRRSDAEILERYPPSWISARVQRELGRDPAKRRRMVWTIAGAAGLLAAAAILWWSSSDPTVEAPATDAPLEIAQRDPTPPRGDEPVRAKGDAKLLLYLQEGSGSRLLHSGDLVAPGDVLQVAYASGDARYGVIASLDGSGNVSLHWPREAGDDAQLARGTIELEYSFRLDDAPGYERFFFVTSADPLDARRVMDSIAALGSEPGADQRPLTGITDGFTQSILLRKPPRE